MYRRKPLEASKLILWFSDPSESSQASYEEFAQVPHPIVCATLNTSQVSTFESKGHPLRLCVWGRIITSGGQWETILIDEQTVRNSGWTPVYGIYYVGNGLDDGNCSISIESVAQRDIGTWSCTLLSKAGTVFQGVVDVHDVGKLSLLCIRILALDMKLFEFSCPCFGNCDVKFNQVIMVVVDYFIFL